MAVDESFDKLFFNTYLGKKFKILRGRKDITFEKLAEKVWVSYAYIVNMFNGRQIWSLEAWKRVADGLGISEKEFNTIIKEAKKAEYEHSTWDTLNLIPEININTLEGLDLDNTDLIRVVMKREMWREPTDQDIQTILAVIKMQKK